jgi:hypothetical protein
VRTSVRCVDAEVQQGSLLLLLHHVCVSVLCCVGLPQATTAIYRIARSPAVETAEFTAFWN